MQTNLHAAQRLTEEQPRWEPVWAGSQQFCTWSAGDTEPKTLYTFTGDSRAGVALTLTGSNVLLTIETGTSGKHRLVDVQAPARFTAWGAVQVFACPYDGDLPAEARVMVGFTTVPMVPDVAQVVTGPFVFQDGAVAFRALDACALVVRGVAVALVAGQAIELRGPASLTSGTGTVLYEP